MVLRRTLKGRAAASPASAPRARSLRPLSIRPTEDLSTSFASPRPSILGRRTRAGAERPCDPPRHLCARASLQSQQRTPCSAPGQAPTASREVRSASGRGPRAGRRAEVSAAAASPPVVGCAALAAPWLAAGRGLGGRPDWGRSSGAGRACAALGSAALRVGGRARPRGAGRGGRRRRRGEDSGPWTRGARRPRLRAAGTEPKMSA